MSRLAGIGLVVLTACGGALGADGDRQVRPLAGAEAMASEYRAFLDAGRMPADVVAWTVKNAPGWQVVDLFDVTEHRTRPGDRLVFINRDRSALFVVVGDQPLEKTGSRLVCGHIDTPSPKLVARAVVDGAGQAQLIAHLYGGARRHHWPGIPLGLVGRVARVERADDVGGEEVAVRLGFEGEDPFSFFVTEATDEKLVAIAASTKSKKGTPTLTFVRYLNERYGLTAADLEAAELYLVPAWPAREVGVDRALIGAHGQDDRANSYAAWRALIDVGAAGQPPKHTAIAWLVDREEVGSTGRTSARSRFLEMTYAWLLRAEGARADERTLARTFAASRALSSDTPASLNPNFPEPHIERLAAHLGNGPVMFPYAGRNGKQGSQAARAEIIREALDVFEAAGVPMQTAELGKVEAGGGGTISKYLAERGMDVLDIGISIVAMHSPMELTAKQDIWWGYLGFKAWMQQ